ncbi:DUF2127 domain-containing protein [Pendulispora brunnea]|uniref:DUF2127 domain-containing protein n=1 Tax=Pendulispora brunnea TaxID=2905690 RepID=A0ABZ2JZP1_9BACT
MTRPGALRLIILYKLVRGGLALVLALLVLILAVGHFGTPLADALSGALHHLAHPWAHRAGDALMKAVATNRYLYVAAFALGVDGTFTLLEGAALARGSWWGPWLVVISTSMLLPPEVVGLFRHASAVRAVILVLNVAIVAYLVSHARRTRA